MCLTCWAVPDDVVMGHKSKTLSLTRPRTDDGTLAFGQQMIKIPSVTESVSLVVNPRAAGVVDTGLFALFLQCKTSIGINSHSIKHKSRDV